MSASKNVEAGGETVEVQINCSEDGNPQIECEPAKKKLKGSYHETPSTVEIEILPLYEHTSMSPIDEKSVSSENGLIACNTKSSFNDIARKRIRVIKPYPFTFSTFAKARWIGRSIIDIYTSEFGSYPRSYYELSIKEGRILVSGRRVTCDYVVKNADELCHTVHRHEPAVSLCDYDNDSDFISSPWIKILYEDNNIIAVCKPPTLPIHPCGAYHYNSLFYILSEQRSDLNGNLYTVHRLGKVK